MLDQWQIVGSVLLTAEATILFMVLEPNPSQARRVFHSEHSTSIVIGLWASGVSVGMAAYAPPVPEEFLYLSYAALIAATVFSLGMVVSSRCNTIIKRIWRVIGCVLIVAVALILILLVRRIHVSRELSLLNGVLIPANDPDPIGTCSGVKIPESSLRFYFGIQEVVVYGNKGVIVGRGRRGLPLDSVVVLGVNREPDGTISIEARIFGDDNKRLIVFIDRNHFEINRNMILDSLSPPRPDASTILIKDQSGNTLKVRLINKHSMSFEGRLYVKPGQYVEFSKSGMKLGIDSQPGSIREDSSCHLLSNPEEGGLLGVEE
jgi:hypothetical protein